MSKAREDAAIVGLVMGAGALVAGGAAGASHLVERANRKRNLQRQRESRAAVHDAMQAEIELAELEREAAIRGVDVRYSGRSAGPRSRATARSSTCGS